jgi:hypothetical protein
MVGQGGRARWCRVGMGGEYILRMSGALLRAKVHMLQSQDSGLLSVTAQRPTPPNTTTGARRASGFLRLHLRASAVESWQRAGARCRLRLAHTTYFSGYCQADSGFFTPHRKTNHCLMHTPIPSAAVNRMPWPTPTHSRTQRYPPLPHTAPHPRLRGLRASRAFLRPT